MKLRDHPLMRYYRAHSWPPSWSRRRGSHENTRPIGEIGILKDVLPSTLAPQKICFLTIEHCGAAGIITVDSDWGEVRADAGSKVELTASRLFLQILQGAKSRGELEDEA